MWNLGLFMVILWLICYVFLAFRNADIASDIRDEAENDYKYLK